MSWIVAIADLPAAPLAIALVVVAFALTAALSGAARARIIGAVPGAGDRLIARRGTSRTVPMRQCAPDAPGRPKPRAPSPPPQ